ncbi:hypothetical protein WAK64_09815 [Bacillus spongiae]|uniref:HEAT repeat domain-containing protein n=1 Tax=Bacillus spongiae TaxID=2683610 RepID=A0ABU8HDQ3_9BACI
MTLVENIKRGLFSDNSSIRTVSFHMLEEIPKLPDPLLKELLEAACDFSEITEDVLYVLLDRDIPGSCMDSLLKLIDLQNDSILREQALQILEYTEPATLVRHEKAISSYFSPEKIAFFHLLANGNEKELWDEFHLTLVALNTGEGNLYKKTRMLAKVIAQKGLIDDFTIDSVMNDDLNEGIFTFEGIIMVYIIGVLKKSKYIPILSNLLYSEDDFLLDEVELALKSFQTDEVVHVLIPYLTDPHSMIYAASIVGSIQTPLATKALQKAYLEVRDLEEKSILFEVLCYGLREDALPEINDFLAKGYTSQLIDTEEAAYGFFKLLELKREE